MPTKLVMLKINIWPSFGVQMVNSCIWIFKKGVSVDGIHQMVEEVNDYQKVKNHRQKIEWKCKEHSWYNCLQSYDPKNYKLKNKLW